MDQHRVMEHDELRAGRSSGTDGVLVFVPNSSAPKELGWRAVYASARGQIGLHVAILIVCILGGAAFAFLPTPVYRAQITVLRLSNSEQNGILSSLGSGGAAGALAGLAGINLDMDDFKKESLALLTSRDFTVQFIQQENLMPLLFPDMWDSHANRWRTDDPNKVPTLDKALDLFDKDVRVVSEDRRNGLTLVSMEWPDRFLAAKWANSYVARANAQLRQRNIEYSRRSLEFLNQKLADTTVREIQQTLYRLMETELRRITLASVREEYAYRVIDSARVPLASKRVRPHRTLSLLGGLAAALLLSGWIAWARARARLSADAPPQA
jgi:uncharacterized protein involved in exopolysaccharide biosynthesis